MVVMDELLSLLSFTTLLWRALASMPGIRHPEASVAPGPRLQSIFKGLNLPLHWTSIWHICVYIYVCVYVTCMYVCMDGWMDGCMHACMHVCMYVCIHM